MSLFWQDKKVFVTGHTGFKGSWLTLFLKSLGAEVTGYSLQEPPSNPCLFELAEVANDCNSLTGDICDFDKLSKALSDSEAEIVFHLAAQPLVRYSYFNPLETFQTNVMGTANLLEASRNTNSVKVFINVTSDKCYENREDGTHFVESDKLGGRDPYSASKACAELVASSYHQSYPDSQFAIASVRAGNVIGGGDFARDRLFPDIIRAFMSESPLALRNPAATRPWQHVLDPLAGYILLARRLYNDFSLSGAYNFGPELGISMTVLESVERIAKLWGKDLALEINSSDLHEAKFLQLDSSKARKILGWKGLLDREEMLFWSTQWYKAYVDREHLRSFTLQQLNLYKAEVSL